MYPETEGLSHELNKCPPDTCLHQCAHWCRPFDSSLGSTIKNSRPKAAFFMKTNPNFDTNVPPFGARGCKVILGGAFFNSGGCKLGLGGCKRLRLIKMFTEKLFCFGNTYNLKHIFTAIASKNNVSTANITVSVAAHSN